ncbi:MAG: hypothetical protein DPW16_00570 [Chloroflexi bacterium]|nr:hypothetical protein [Chloroflexota bacterium]
MDQGRPIPRLQTVDQWEHEEGSNWSGRLAWLIFGFNIGFVVPILLIFIVLPVVLPEFHFRRAESISPKRVVAYQVITHTPAPTLTPTNTLPPSLTPTPSVTPTIDNGATLESIFVAQTQTAFVLTAAAPTLPPTVPPSPTPIPPTPTPLPPPQAYTLEGVKFFQQGWNNCGPANLAMGLSYFNWQGTQDDTATYLKPDREDKNVTPQQMVDYVNRFTNLKAIWRMAGSLDQIRWLIANRFVVIVESGYEPAGEGWFGHYETVIAYDTPADTITVYDSYLGRDSRPTVTYPSTKFDSQWQSFNRNFIVIYVPEREGELAAFLGSDWVENLNRQKAAQVAQQEAASDPENPYVWSNLGTSLTSIGRYPEAVTAYQQALDLGLPYRFFWYQYGVFEALLQTSRLEDVRTLVNSTLKTTSYVEEMYYYLGRVYEIQGNYALAQTEYQEALQRNPNYELAAIALRRIGGT